MSTDFYFEYNTNRGYEYCKILAKNELREVLDENRIKDNERGTFCVGDSPGNGAWITLSKNGMGSMTRYAGTSTENLKLGFKLLECKLHVENMRSEYDIGGYPEEDPKYRQPMI